MITVRVAFILATCWFLAGLAIGLCVGQIGKNPPRPKERG